MPLIMPTIKIKSVNDITYGMIKKMGIKGILLDVDNTLCKHDSQHPINGVREWIDNLKNKGLTIAIVSNNSEERVSPFARKMGLKFFSRGAKPLPKGFNRAAKEMNFNKKELVVIGDQLFTDILGANLAGIKSILVEPIELEKTGFLAFKRKLEKPLLKKIDKKLNYEGAL